MDDHVYFEELLSLKLDGELTDEQERELEEHLESCPDCRETYELLTGVRQALDFEVEPPESLASGVMDAVRADISAKKALRHRRISIAAGIFAAAAVLAVAIIPGTVRQKDMDMDSQPVLFSAPEAPATPVAPAMPEARDADVGEPAVCDITDGEEPVLDVPDESVLTREDLKSAYAAVYTFSEIPEELTESGEPIALDDGTLCYALPMELLATYENDALMVEICDDPTAALGIALKAPDSQGQ